MTNDDNLLDEIFHETRRALKVESSCPEEETASDYWRSWENLNIAASDTWRVQDDSFKFACRRIKTRAKEIEKRLNKVTSADILASLSFYVHNNKVKGTLSDESVSPEHKSKRRVRFLFQQEEDPNNTAGNEEKVDSLVQRIQQWLDPNAGNCYPQIGDHRNKILSAYWDAVRVVGQGRTDEITFYNNPFDPRLRFEGLAHHVSSNFDGHLPENKPGGNVLLWLNNSSDVVDECLQKYSTYLKELRQDSRVLRDATDKPEANSLKAPSPQSKVRGCEFGPSDQVSTDLSAEEELLVEKLRSVRGLWSECRENQGSQIPRRITCRKPPVAQKRRLPVVSHIRPSAWPAGAVPGSGESEVATPQVPVRGILRKTKVDVPTAANQQSGDNVEPERHSPQIWQKIAEEHIDEESLKHIQNATKERAGVKIMLPTSQISESPPEVKQRPNASCAFTILRHPASTRDVQQNHIAHPSAETVVSKADTWAARVAQHVQVLTSTNSSGTNQAPTYTSPRLQKAKQQVRQQYTLLQSSHVTFPTGTSTGSDTRPHLTGPPPPRELLRRDVNTPSSHVVPSVERQTSRSPDSIQNPHGGSLQNTGPAEVAPNSSELKPNSISQEWLKRLISRTGTKSSSSTKSEGNGVPPAPSRSATTVSQSIRTPFVCTSASSSEHTAVESREEVETEDYPSRAGPRVEELRRRPPPGFEKTVLETIPQPMGNPPQHALHLPQFQAPGTAFTGVNGETFIRQPTGYAPGPARVLHQFQRPLTQIGGNIAIWHPRPSHGNFVVTDVHGKPVGLGVPAWNRVEIQGRPHVVLHQPQIPGGAMRTSVRQAPVFPPGNNQTSFLQPTFMNHIPPQQGPQDHIQQVKPPETPPLPNGSATGYERGDHFTGFPPSGLQATHVAYQTRPPQFIAALPHGQSMMQDYTLYAPNQQKMTQPYPKQPNPNQNNNNSFSGVSDYVEQNVRADEEKIRIPPRHEIKVYKVSRAIRANLIQLA